MTTRLETFARKVADEYKLEDQENLQFDYLALVQMIMTVVMSIVEDCPEKRQLPAVLGAGVTLFQRVKTKRATYTTAKCCGFPMFRSEAGEIANTIVDVASREEKTALDSIVTELSDDSNWLF